MKLSGVVCTRKRGEDDGDRRKIGSSRKPDIPPSLEKLDRELERVFVFCAFRWWQWLDGRSFRLLNLKLTPALKPFRVPLGIALLPVCCSAVRDKHVGPTKPKLRASRKDVQMKLLFEV